MSIENIGVTGWKVAQFIERNAAKNNQKTYTTIRHGRYIVRIDLNNGKYSRTVINTNKEGNATTVYSDVLLRNARKLKEKLISFVQSQD